jgi:transcriptional regulator with XRE-family HTH domain
MSDLSWGQRIRNLQEKLGLTTAEIALKIRVSEGTVYALSRNSKRIPSRIVQDEIIKLEQGDISNFKIEDLKQNISTIIKRSKPIIYETELLTDEQKIKLLRIINDFIHNLNEFEF